MSAVGLVCPVHRQAVVSDGDGALICAVGGERFPIVDGIAVMLADEVERKRIAGGTLGTERGDAAGFYNSAFAEQAYSATSVEPRRQEVLRAIGAAPAGAVVEIGPGRGHLQGITNTYVAVDYSLAALRSFVDRRWQRICATAEQLPLADKSVACVFSIDTLEHVPRADLALAEIDRVLMGGGVAYLRPAWRCTQYNCEGISVRRWGELTLRQKWIKATLGVRRNPLGKAAVTVPWRAMRRLEWKFRGGPTRFRFGRLRPDYKTYWIADSDAVSRLDAHEACVWFASRGYEVMSPGAGAVGQLFTRHEALIVRKGLPADAGGGA